MHSDILFSQNVQFDFMASFHIGQVLTDVTVMQNGERLSEVVVVNRSKKFFLSYACRSCGGRRRTRRFIYIFFFVVVNELPASQIYKNDDENCTKYYDYYDSGVIYIFHTHFFFLR